MDVIKVLIIGAVVGGAYVLYQKSKKRKYTAYENDGFQKGIPQFVKENKSLLDKYLIGLMGNEYNKYKHNYLSIYFNITSLQKQYFSNVKVVSGPQELGITYNDILLAYEYLSNKLQSELSPESQLNDAMSFIVIMDYYKYLGKKKAFEEVSEEFELEQHQFEKYQEVSGQLNKEFENLRST